ncbi:MAG: response regulator [Dehalococcoidales bacterium]|nr:response regulator [Dehalococcoidales bacterium]
MSNPQLPGKITALVVDDEEIILSFLKRLLNSWGYEAETINTPREAIESIKKNDYDFILLDVKMPDINGQQLYDMIAEFKPSLINRVIFATGDVMNKSTASFLNETQAPVLTKPIDTHELKEHIDKILSVK